MTTNIKPASSTLMSHDQALDYVLTRMMSPLLAASPADRQDALHVARKYDLTAEQLIMRITARRG